MTPPNVGVAPLPRELQLLLQVTRRLPPLPRVTGIVNHCLKPFYLRHSRSSVVVDVLGSLMQLAPDECVDGALLFYPHLYDRHEIGFLRETLRPGDAFLDIGANVGFYTLVASRLVGPLGHVVAVEADPYNFDKLSANIAMNAMTNVAAINCGVADCHAVLSLGLNTHGNRGGNSFLTTSGPSVDVKCQPLAEVVTSLGERAIRVAKLDIEGFEFRVMRRFFNDVDRRMYPEFIIVERNASMIHDAGGDIVALLDTTGYSVLSRHGDNWIMALQAKL